MMHKKSPKHSLPLGFFFVIALFLLLVACQSEEAPSPSTPTAEPETAVSTTTETADTTTTINTESSATAEPVPTDTVVPATNTPMPTPTVAPLILDTLDGPVEVQPLPPVSYDELLDNGIEAEEWTETEGIILLLKSFVGEIDSGALPEVIETSSTPIVRRAADVANDTNTNADDKAEIERLLNILILSPEALDQLSIPASESAAKPNTVFKSAAQEGECADLATQGYDANEIAGVACYLYEEVQLEGHNYRVYYPTEWKEDDNKRELIDAALSALTDSASVYNKLAKIEDVNLVFSYADGGNALAQQSYFDLDSACPITLFANTNQGDLAKFKQTIAHEAFHCVQDWNFTSSPYGSHKWWLEGSAEYFSNVVYPTTNDEHRFLENFNRSSTYKPLMKMSYHNFIFFQYIANRLGDQGLIDLLEAMSATGTVSAQTSYLGNYPEMEGMFQDFVISFLSEGIPDTGGGNIKPSDGIYISGKKTIDDEGEFDFDTTPFVAKRYRVQYVKEKRFLLSDKEDGNGRYSTVLKELRQDKSAWSGLPEEIRSKCDKPVVYILATTSVKEPFTYTIDVTKVEKAECDPCLLGSWDIEPNSFEAFMMGLMAQTPEMPAGFTIEIAGHDYVTFEEDGQMSTLRDDFQIIMGIPGAPKVYTTINSHGNGMYTADGEIISVEDLVDTVDTIQLTTADGQIMTTMAGSTSNVSFFGNSATVQTEDINSDQTADSATGTYICTEETLEITIPEGMVLFLRVEEIPPTPVPTPSP